MSRTFVQPGKVVSHTAASAISSGDIVVMGDIIGVALADIASGEVGSVSIQGVHKVAKVAGTAWGQGAKLDWDASAEAFDIAVTPASGDVEDAGVAASAAGSADTTGEILLTPGVGTGA